VSHGSAWRSCREVHSEVGPSSFRATAEEAGLARRANYGFEKRQKKKEQKREERRARKQGAEDESEAKMAMVVVRRPRPRWRMVIVRKVSG
jgi:hypothetical protein